MTGVPIKRGNLGTDTHTGRCHVQMKAEIRVMHLQAKDHLAQSATTRGCGGRQAEAREKLGERPRRGWGVGQDKGQGRGQEGGQTEARGEAGAEARGEAGEEARGEAKGEAGGEAGADGPCQPPKQPSPPTL